MSDNRPTYAAAKSGDAIYVKVRGLGSMHNVPSFEDFAQTAIAEGARQIVLDLKRCTGVDSTFMGTLLGLHNALGDQHGDDEGVGIVIVNIDDHARNQLTSVGLDAFMTLTEGKTRLPRKLKLIALDGDSLSDRERLKVMVRVHKALVAADPRNEAKFGPFLKGIVAELGSD